MHRWVQCRPHPVDRRRLQETANCSVGQQRFNFAKQLAIVTTGFIEKSGPRGGRKVDSLRKEGLDAPGALGLHGSASSAWGSPAFHASKRPVMSEDISVFFIFQSNGCLPGDSRKA